MSIREEITIRELTEEIERLTAELAALQGKHEEVIRGRNLATERAEKAEETLRKVREECDHALVFMRKPYGDPDLNAALRDGFISGLHAVVGRIRALLGGGA